MLINTVILFLRDALPIFIIAVLLLTAERCYKRAQRWLTGGIIAGLVAALILINSIGVIVQSVDSTGLEWLFSLGYLLIYLFILMH
ncbi:MAG: high-affinity iron transporter, partial [Alteromonadaceae bacterium]